MEEMEKMEKIKRNINNKTILAAAISACILIIFVTIMRYHAFFGFTNNIDLSQMSGDMYTDDDGTRYLNSGISKYVLYGPYMYLEKGYYIVDIDYKTDNDCTMDVYSNTYGDCIVTSDINLKAINTHKTFEVRLTEDIPDLELRVNYSGTGYLEVSALSITQDTAGIKKEAFLSLAAVIILCICWFKREWIKSNKMTITVIAILTFLSCVPEMTLGMCTGHDGEFHLLRIEGIAVGLRQGQFPVRMQQNWFEGYGYPVSIYYGDILLYIPALLRIIGFSVTQAYKAYLLLINLATTIIAYLCFNKLVKNDRAALFAAAGYLFATYRLTNVYVRLAVGEYSAITFLPLIFLAVYNIYTEDEKKLRSYMKNAVLLAIGMTGLIHTHLISVVTVSITIAIVCLIMIKKTLRKNTLIAYACAVALTLAVNLFFIVPFMDYSQNVDVKIMDNTQESEESKTLIQSKGAFISQYFMLYQKAYGNGKSDNIGDRMAITPGITLMAVLFAGAYFAIKNKDKIIGFMILMAMLALWMSSNIFPWNHIIINMPFMSWISNIQFPWRFMPIAQLFLSITLGMLLVKIKADKKELLYAAVLLLLIITTSQMFSGVIQQRAYAQIYSAETLNSMNVVNGEYIRKNTRTSRFDGRVHSNDVEIIGDYTRDGKYAIIECKTADDSTDAWVEFPIMNYKNYAAYGEFGRSFEITDGENNVIRVLLPAAYSGIVKVVYEIPGIYRAADICSLITVIVMIVITLLERRKNRRRISNV